LPTIAIALVLVLDTAFGFHSAASLFYGHPKNGLLIGNYFSRSSSIFILGEAQREHDTINGEIAPQNCILTTLEAQGLSEQNKQMIIHHLDRVGLWEDKSSSEDLILLAQDFVDRPEVFSSLLINDFDFPPLVAHQNESLGHGTGT
jgi:hypothetical protein